MSECWKCHGEGWLITCIDDICHGSGHCMHTDGEELCAVCGGEGWIGAEGEDEDETFEENLL